MTYKYSFGLKVIFKKDQLPVKIFFLSNQPLSLLPGTLCALARSANMRMKSLHVYSTFIAKALGLLLPM